MSTPAPLVSQQTQAGEVKLWVPNQGYVTAQAAQASTDALGKSSAPLGALIVPPGIPISNSGTGLAAAALTVALGPVAGLTNFLTGFDLTMVQVTSVSGLLTVTGLKGGTGTLNFQVNDAVGSGELFQWRAPYPLAASGPNTAISVVLPAIVGGGASAINVYGYQQ